MTALSIDTLIHDLRLIAGEYTTTLNDEGNAIRAAKFAHAVGLQDKKIDLHQRLFNTLETIRLTPKSESQKTEIRALIALMSTHAHENKKSIELGFGAIERLTGRIFSVMRKAVQSNSASYTANGKYHNARNQSANLQTDTKA